MDGKSLPQSSDVTERSYRRRISSILKAPRSPLKDLGSGNEICQEPTVEKRRKSSRRVSFADNIRVFAPELQATGSADKENEAFGTTDLSSNIKGPECDIAGMDTLLHGPIQVPVHNADWNYADDAKERTIFFASDNDMDMTASNTVAIHGLVEEKPKKIDTSQFLASLKSQSAEEVAQNKEFQHLDSKTDSSTETKLKFSNFLASLGIEKPKATNYVVEAEKENFFPFASTHFYSQENTGNVTKMFREQDDGLDLTKCHTTNIDTFLPMFNSTLNHDKRQSKKFPLADLPRSIGSNDQTVFLEDDMDITCSHTTRIRQEAQRNETGLPSTKTIIFCDEDEMELAKNNLVLLNGNPSATSSQRKDKAFVEHTTLLPHGEDMDITKSHTVAIDALTLDQWKPPCNVAGKTSTNNTKSNNGDRTVMFTYEQDDMELTKSHTVAIDAKKIQELSKKDRGPYFSGLKIPSVTNKSILFSTDGDDMELTQSHTVCIDQKALNKSNISSGVQQRLSINSHVKTSNLDFPEKDNARLLDKMTAASKRKSLMNATSHIPDDMEMTVVTMNTLGKNPSSVAYEGNRTVMFTYDQQDMEMTRSHTVSIDSKVLSENPSANGRNWPKSKEHEDNAVVNLKEADKMAKSNFGLSDSSMIPARDGEPCKATVIFGPDQDDMDITYSHTAAIKHTFIPDNSDIKKSVPLNVRRSVANKTFFEDDMELTKSHTMVIDEGNTLGLCRQTTSVKNATTNLDNVIINPNAGCREEDYKPQRHDEAVYQGGDMEMTDVNVGLVIAAGKPQTGSQGNHILFQSFKDKTMFLEDQDDMDITRAHTVAIENKMIDHKGLPRGGEIELKVNAGAEKLKSWGTKNPLHDSFRDKTVYLGDQDDMDMTRAHTVAIENKMIDYKGLPRGGEIELKVNAGAEKLKSWGTKNPLHDSFRDKTVYLGDQDDMDMTRAHTVAIESKMIDCKGVPREGRTEQRGLNAGTESLKSWDKRNSLFQSFKDATLYLGDQDDMDMTRAHTVAIENKMLDHKGHPQEGEMGRTDVNAGAGKVKSWDKRNSLYESLRDKTMNLGDQDDMDMTRAHTVAIENKMIDYKGLPHGGEIELKVNAGAEKLKSWGTKNPLHESFRDKTVYLGDQDDMDMTRAHTVAIESKMIDCKGLPHEDKIELNDVDAGAEKVKYWSKRNSLFESFKDKTVYLGDQDDMDMTRAHTIAIENKVIDHKGHSGEGEMEMTGVNASLLIGEKSMSWGKRNPLCESLRDKTMYLGDRDDMDMTRAHTVAIENKVIAEMDIANLKNKSQNIAMSASGNKSQLGDVIYISNSRSVQGFKESYVNRTQFDLDMDLTMSNTVCIQSADSANDLQLPISKSKVLPSVRSQQLDHMQRDKDIDLVFEGKRNHLEKNTPISSELHAKTLVLLEQNDMDITRSHTIAIESKMLEPAKAPNVLKFQDIKKPTNRSDLIDLTSNSGNIADDTTSKTGTCSKDEDLDFTKSNTVFIDHLADKDVPVLLSKRKSVSFNPKSIVPSNETILQVCNMKETSVDVHLIENLADNITSRICSKDEDMDFTKSNTVFIDHLPDKGVCVSGLFPKRKSVSFNPTSIFASNETILQVCNMEETSVDVHLAENLASITGVCSKDEEMDFTKSNTVFIDHLSDKGVQVKDALIKRKSVSFRPKPYDETILQVCNMEETNIPADLTLNLENKSNFDKTLCNQGDMEMTKCYTVAIENKIEDAAHGVYPEGVSSQLSRDMTLRDHRKSYGCHKIDGSQPNNQAYTECVPHVVSKEVYKDLSMPPVPTDATLTRTKDFQIFPSEEQSMDITIAHTAAVEANVLDHTARITSIKGDIELANGIKAQGKLVEQKYLNEPLEKSETTRRKSYARSLSMAEKTGVVFEGLGNDELSQVHTHPVEHVSLLKTGPCDMTEMDLTLNKEPDHGVDFTDHKFKQRERISIRTSISTNADAEPNSRIGSVCRIESEPSVYDSRLLEVNTENLKTTHEPINPGALSHNSQCLVSDSRGSVPPDEQKTCGLPVDSHQIGPDVEQEQEMKKAKFKGKRVSFHFPEKEIVQKNVVLDPSSEPTVFQQEKVESTDGTVHDTEPVPVCRSDFINQTSVIGAMEDPEKRESNLLHKNPEIEKLNVGSSEGISNVEGSGNFTELSEESRNKRRSISDIQLKIKRLSQKSKTSLHNTASVSSLIDQLPPTSQTRSEQASIDTQLPNIETTDENEPNEKNKTTTRENRLSHRLSVKIFQPKLPNKRTSSTGNSLEPVSSSLPEVQPQKDPSSKDLLKTFSAIDDGLRIDEEMLPACPDDQDINGIFQYEVPEGAWEELCQEEALQQDLDISTTKDSLNGQKRGRETEDDSESQREKRARWNEEIVGKDDAATSVSFKSCEKSYRSDYSAHPASKSMEQTYYSSSSQDSRGDGMSVELNSQQCSQMESQLPWDTGCEQSLWQKFQDGTITVQEFFVLLRIRILIQKPRYSERPSKRGTNEDLTASEILLDQYVYQPKLQVYEECHTLYQKIEELKVSTELQHKPLVQVNSLLWEAMRMCSENELMYFGVTLKNMKSLYSKKSKLLVHEEKVSTYSKLLQAAQAPYKQLKARIGEIDELLKELDDCISILENETSAMTGNYRNDNPPVKVQACMQLQTDINHLKSQEQQNIRESLELEERKQKLLGMLGSLQEEARVLDKRLQEPSFTEWELETWTDKKAEFIFLYDSIELFITFGDYIEGDNFNNQPCKRISSVTMESQLNDTVAPPSSVLVHQLIFQYTEKKGALHETYKTQNDLPRLLSDVSLMVSRCRLLGEELEYLMKWGAKYHIVKTQVQNHEVRLLFSSLAALAKFELTIHLADTYPTTPLVYTVKNHIGGIDNARVSEIISKVPTGLWYLKRTVKSLHQNLLVS
ncbi:outer kinetochore KNL1 complex subunit KNL1 isoform X2 [Engystomops pustulosus]|uniref:outer kinetochore KNL1 complex subunit KNL1 isoform X2 n=1 Tax=Engystomops pustulosus TaxID=76066 RepID=UPI003AFA073A